MRKNENDKNKSAGITLIALVVTIIVLLILAGISVQMLTGGNGILQRAGEAKEKTGTVGLKEEVQIALMEKQIDSSIGTDSKTLRERIESGISDAKIEEIIGTDGTSKYTDVYYVKKGNDYVTVYEDGDIEEGKSEIWDGKKISCPKFKEENGVWNWYIYTPSQLKFLADFVNNENKLTDNQKILVRKNGYNADEITMTENSTVYLMKNIDLGARITKTETDNRVKITKKTGEDWTPIGIDDQNKKFIGKFEGQNHYIKGIYINSNLDFVGLFGTASNIIKDLTIKESYIKGSNKVGGVVGYYSSNSTTIDNCTNNAMVCGVSRVGGIVGDSNQGKIINCINNGRIQACQGAGGIAGFIRTSEISLSTNTGLIKYELIDGYNSYKQDFGGICGILSPECKILRAYNSGDIEGITFSGGIVGRTSKSSIMECYSKGKVENTFNHEYNVGEIIGYIAGDIVEDITIDKVYYLEKENQKRAIGKYYENGADIYSQNIKSIENNFNSLKEFIRMAR